MCSLINIFYFQLSHVFLYKHILFIYFQLSYVFLGKPFFQLSYVFLDKHILFIYFPLFYVFLDKPILFIYFQLSYVFLDIFVQELFPELRGWTTYTYCTDLLCNQISFWHFLFKSVLTTSNIYVLYCVSCHNGLLTYYPLANEVAKGYSNATVRPSVTSLWTL
jgi:hypothetical protein